ncbi:MAG TPA: head maturation protease, ClpP-related, partial [Solirubrobacterales bacterium]
GGYVDDGVAIFNSLIAHKGKVTVVVDAIAASSASVIAMAGDRVVIAPKASMMIHDGWTMAIGNAADLRKTADLLDKQSGVIASVYADRTNQPVDFWRDAMREETWYTADEALAAGLVDEIEGQEKKSDEGFDLGVFNHAGREKAPAPKIKAEVVETPAGTETSPAAPPVEQPKAEEKPFTWDFSTFKSALTEGVKYCRRSRSPSRRANSKSCSTTGPRSRT